MNIRKGKLDLYKTVISALEPHLEDVLTEEQHIILHLYLIENKGLIDIATHLNFSNYQIVKEELRNIEAKILSL